MHVVTEVILLMISQQLCINRYMQHISARAIQIGLIKIRNRGREEEKKSLVNKGNG